MRNENFFIASPLDYLSLDSDNIDCTAMPVSLHCYNDLSVFMISIMTHIGIKVVRKLLKFA